MTRRSAAPEDAVVIPDDRPEGGRERGLGDFSTTNDVLVQVGLAVVIGALVAGVALGLLDLIGLLTHLFTATIFTRMLLTLWVRWRRPQELPV